jgi:amino acid adenylation domain-containing protein
LEPYARTLIMPPDLINRLQHIAATTPARVALRDAQQSIRYDELAVRVRHVAGQLIALGLRPGNRLVIWANKRPETVITLLGALAAGVVIVPLHPAQRATQLHQVFTRAEAHGLIIDKGHAHALALSTEQFDSVTPTADANVLGFCTTPEQSPIRFNTAKAHPNQEDCAQAPQPEALAALLYTSGSTGQPKGVMVTHANLTIGAQAVCDYLGLTAEDEILAVLPLSFDYGLSQITTALMAGAGIYLQDYLLPNDLRKPLLDAGITVLAGTPGLLIPLSHQSWLPDCAALRIITNSGGRLPVSAVKAIRVVRPSTRLFLMYGLTEAFRASFLPPDEVDAHPDSIGRAFAETTLGLMDEQGRLYPGEGAAEGELIQGGPLVTDGYFNDPIATAERFRAPPAGWPNPEDDWVVFSGDRIRRDADGRLHFLGRLDDQIKHQGFRVSPEEIETAALQFPGLREALAFGYAPPDDPDASEKIGLVIAPTFDTQALGLWLKQTLAPYQQPAHIMTQNSLPRSANGKLDRHAAREMLITTLLGAHPDGRTPT